MLAQLLEDDSDPILSELQTLDYRYVRFFFHPLKDRFVVCNGWKDPSWTRVRDLRSGIDGDEKDQREHVFGANIIDIEQKSIPQLLMDEVCYPTQMAIVGTNVCANEQGLSSLLYLPNRKFDTMVVGPVLLLCYLHIRHVCRKHHRHACRDACCKFTGLLSFRISLSSNNHRRCSVCVIYPGSSAMFACFAMASVC